MKHLFRAGALLVVVLLLVFVGLRVMPVPASLEEYGFHPQETQENTEMWASLPIQYANSSTCLDCHQDKYTEWLTSKHSTVNCENCHGPTKEHLETGAPLILDTSRELCGLCHAKLVARPSNFPQVDMDEMGGEADCTTCHNPHDPRAGIPSQVPHDLEGRTDCQVCHAPHEPLVHIPPQIPHSLEGRTDCLLCHNSDELSKTAPPGIPHNLEGRANCLTCHNEGGIKPFPESHAGRTSDTCLNCHRSK